MKTIKEKLTAIWHIITDHEFIVFTATVKNGKRKRCIGLISDNVSDTVLRSAIKLQNKHLSDRLNSLPRIGRKK